jgi:hypothetical protein
MIFAFSGPPQYTVVLFTGGKMGDIGFVYRNKFKTVKITGQTAFLKKSEFVLPAYRYSNNYEKIVEKAFTASSAAI